MNKGILVALAIALLVVVGAALKMKFATQERAEAMAAAAAQRTADAQAEERRKAAEAKQQAISKMSAEEQAYIAQSEADKSKTDQVQAAASQVDVSAKQVADLYVRWKDADKIASSVGRIAMAQPVAELQKIKRDLDALTVSECMKAPRATLATGMEKQVGAYLSFMQGNDFEALAYAQMKEGKTLFDQFEQSISNCRS